MWIVVLFFCVLGFMGEAVAWEKGLLPGPSPRSWHVEHQRQQAWQDAHRHDRRERRRERRWERRAWQRYEKPTWQGRTIRRHGQTYRLAPVPRQWDTR